MARWIEIVDKGRRPLAYHASAHDFTTGNESDAQLNVVLENPNLSLYCLDHDRREAVFVELPEAAELGVAPFIYMAQYEHAKRLLSVPYVEFFKLARELSEMNNFVMIYMTGRSGSTLLSKAMNRAAGAVSLSEPDAPVGLVQVQRARAAEPHELSALFDASVRFLFRRANGSMPQTCVLKLRSEALQLSTVIDRAYPQTRSLFLYRDAVGWVGSFYRIMVRLGDTDNITRERLIEWFDLGYGLDAKTYLGLLDADQKFVSPIEFLALWWIAVVDMHLDAVARGLHAPAFKYQDVTQDSDRFLAAAMAHSGFSNEDIQRARGAYVMDSQAGSPFAQAEDNERHLRLTSEQTRTVRDLVARHVRFQDTEFEVPGTVYLKG